MIVSQGGAFAGWSLYVRDGRPKYAYNLFGVHHFKISGDAEIPSGTHQVRMEFTYDGGGLGKGGDVALYLDGSRTGEGRVEGTVPMLFSGDETCDIGSDTASPVSDEYAVETSHFNGTVEWVSSTSPTPPKTSTTSSPPTSGSRSPWRATPASSSSPPPPPRPTPTRPGRQGPLGRPGRLQEGRIAAFARQSGKHSAVFNYFIAWRGDFRWLGQRLQDAASAS